VSWQETELLEQVVQSGDLPDVVVFLDGFNDSLAAFDGRPPWFGRPLEPMPMNAMSMLNHEEHPGQLLDALASHSGFAHLRDALFQQPYMPRVPLTVPADEAAMEAARSLAMSADLVFRIASGHGFRAACFLQPTLHTRARLFAGEPELRNWGSPYIGSVYRHVLSRVRALDTRIVPVTDAYDALEEPVMIDGVHTNEAGYHAVAEAIFRHIAPMLDEAASRSRQTADVTPGAQ
jgi:lysophospholipase L1-like esterase